VSASVLVILKFLQALADTAITWCPSDLEFLYTFTKSRGVQRAMGNRTYK